MWAEDEVFLLAMSNLIRLQREYVLSTIDSIETDHGLKFLVIDAEVKRFFDMLNLTERELLSHVTSVDFIDSKSRKGQPGVSAVYMLKATQFNINCMDVDFQNRPPKYKNAHVLFLVGIGGTLSEFYRSKRFVTQFTRSVKMLNMNFMVKESQYFQAYDIDKPLQLLFNPNCRDLIDDVVERTVRALLTMCVMTGEYPIVRYYNTGLCRRIATDFQESLDDHARNNEDFFTDNSRPRSVMVIADRTVDMFAPFLHEFTYQAMAYDLSDNITASDDIYTYEVENEAGEKQVKKTPLLDIYDEDWAQTKHQHITDVLKYVDGKINELIAQNPKLVDRSKAKNAADLGLILAHLSGFDEERRRYAAHKELVTELMQINSQRKLAEWAHIEQNIAGFGLDAQGHKCKHLTDELIEVLARKEPDTLDKIRCIILYAIFRGGLIELDFIKLLTFIGVNEEHEFFHSFMILFKNIGMLGINIIKEDPKTKPFKKVWFSDTIIDDPNVFDTSRYIPAVGNILSKIITNPLLLDEESFPYVKDKPIELLDEEELGEGPHLATQNSTSLRKTRHRANWTKRNEPVDRSPRQRFFFYMAGGITYNEIKSAYDQSLLKNKDVFIGSDGIFTPRSFMRSIEKLDAPREELHLNDDKKVNDRPPEFLFQDIAPTIERPTHVQRVPIHPDQSKQQLTPEKPQEPSSPKKKKRSKFNLFKKKDK